MYVYKECKSYYLMGPFNIPFSEEKHPIWAKLGAFMANSPKQIERIGSVTKSTHTKFYEITPRKPGTSVHTEYLFPA